jgi:hypothetical protein
LNNTGARVPEHKFNQPVPIVARIVWEQDGEEHIETVALGWTGRGRVRVHVGHGIPTAGRVARHGRRDPPLARSELSREYETLPHQLVLAMLGVMLWRYDEYSRPHAELRTRLTTTSASTPHR